MTEKIAVLGTGGTGSVIGGMLTRAGHDTTLIDQWVAHVEAMKTHGLQVSLREEEFRVPVRAYHLYEVCTLHQQFDIVFLACKSYDTRWMVQFIEPYLKPSGVLVSAQNSLNDEWIAPVIGYTRDIACVLTMSSEVFEPGHVKRNTAMDHTTFTLGELHGRITPRLQELQQILSAAGKTELSTNVWGRRWSKLIFNSLVAPVCAITGVGPAHLTQDPRRVQVCLKLGQETLQVGQALGYSLEPVFGVSIEEMLASPEGLLDRMNRAATTEGVEARSFLHQDILKGRRTEVEYINGLVAQKGREAGIPTPVNETATELVKAVERGDLHPDPKNIVRLEG